MSRSASVRRLAATAALLAAAGCDGLPLEADPSGRDRAEAAVDAWVRRHPTEWRLARATGLPLARPAWSPPCSTAPASGLVTVRYETGDAEIDLAFRCTIGDARGAGALRAHFAHVVLQRLPHGIAAPGWRFDVLTPGSAVSTAVAFADAPDGRVLVTIDTPLFAVQGRRQGPDCEPPADAPMPDGCHLQREHRVPLRLALLAPIVAPGAP